MTYTPIGSLGSTNTSTQFSFVSSFTLQNTSTVVETVTACNVVFQPQYSQYLNYTFNGSSVTISGNVPLSVFDRYQLTYVDKWQSDKTQTPVICNIDAIPDHKELFHIQPDTRASIEIPITINLTISTRNIGVPPEEDVVTTSQTSISYTLEVLNNLTYIGAWTKNYFETRY